MTCQLKSVQWGTVRHFEPESRHPSQLSVSAWRESPPHLHCSHNICCFWHTLLPLAAWCGVCYQVGDTGFAAVWILLHRRQVAAPANLQKSHFFSHVLLLLPCADSVTECQIGVTHGRSIKTSVWLFCNKDIPLSLNEVLFETFSLPMWLWGFCTTPTNVWMCELESESTFGSQRVKKRMRERESGVYYFYPVFSFTVPSPCVEKDQFPPLTIGVREATHKPSISPSLITLFCFGFICSFWEGSSPSLFMLPEVFPSPSVVYNN